MTDLTDQLDAIQARVDAATPGHWEASTGMADAAIVFMPDGYSFKINGHPDAKFIAAAREDVPFLLDLARKQQAAIDAISKLAERWNARGESDMKFSKTIPDEDIAMAILTDGAAKVENARHIRIALEAKP